MNSKDMVTVKVYGTTRKQTREELVEFFLEGMIMCEGSERDRYTDIYVALTQGYTFVDQDNGVYL